MLAFLNHWLRVLIAGDSAGSTFSKIGTILLVLIGASVFKSPVGVTYWLPDAAQGGAYQWTVGWLGAVAVAAIYALWAGGIAWVRSRGPRLRVGEMLIPDGETDMFRLSVENCGEGILEPRATLLWVERDGAPDHQAWGDL